MKFGICLPNHQGVTHVDDLVELAVAAEAMGYHSVWVSEHLFHASYVAERLGDAPYHEALTVLTAAACATSQVRLGTSVLVLPWHHPARLAKTIASLDELSSGRVELGVGVAQTRDEYENLGVDFRRRGRIADEMLDAMKALWTQDIPTFQGEFFRFGELRSEPKPLQKPYPPLLIGGNSDRALERVRRHGDGWHALRLSPEQMRVGIQKIASTGMRHSVRAMLTIADAPSDRPIAERRTLRGTAAELAEMVLAYGDAGVDEIVLETDRPDLAETTAIYERFKQEVIERLPMLEKP